MLRVSVQELARACIEKGRREQKPLQLHQYVSSLCRWGSADLSIYRGTVLPRPREAAVQLKRVRASGHGFGEWKTNHAEPQVSSVRLTSAKPNAS